MVSAVEGTEGAVAALGGDGGGDGGGTQEDERDPVGR